MRMMLLIHCECQNQEKCNASRQEMIKDEKSIATEEYVPRMQARPCWMRM
jgi:hypothetical protein